MRGDLVSRPVGEVMQEAENLVKAGVKELLVISQDTSAYGVDVKYRTGFWGGRPLKTRMTELTRALGDLGVWVRLHYVYPYPHVDEVMPLMAEGKILPYLDVPFQHASPRILKLMKRPANAENNLERIRAGARSVRTSPSAARSSPVFPAKPKRNSRSCWSSWRRHSSTASAASPIRRWKAPPPTPCPIRCRDEVREERRARFMAVQEKISARRLQRKVGRTLAVLVDEATGGQGAVGRSSADAPEIDGVVHISKAKATLKPGEFVQVRITRARRARPARRTGCLNHAASG